MLHASAKNRNDFFLCKQSINVEVIESPSVVDSIIVSNYLLPPCNRVITPTPKAHPTPVTGHTFTSRGSSPLCLTEFGHVALLAKGMEADKMFFPSLQKLWIHCVVWLRFSYTPALFHENPQLIPHWGYSFSLGPERKHLSQVELYRGSAHQQPLGDTRKKHRFLIVSQEVLIVLLQ